LKTRAVTNTIVGMLKLKFKTKIALVFFAFFTCISLYMITLFYQKAIAYQKEALRNKLMQISVLGSYLVDAGDISGIKPVPASMDLPQYQDLLSGLRSIMRVHGDIADAYILVPTYRPGIMKFLANADTEEVIDCGEDFDVTPFPELARAFDGPSADKKITRDRWGYWLSGYAPIRDAEGRVMGILGIDISADTIHQMRSHIRNSGVTVFLMGLVFSVIVGNLASWWLTKPLNILVKGMKEISSGNLDHKIPSLTSDEIGQAGENFNKMALRLKEYIDELTRTTKEKERLRRDLEIAAELQQSMLPVRNLEIDDVDLAGLSLPAMQVGGDYFDYMENDPKNIGFVIADASGKGLPGSIFMTNSRSIFKVMATEEDSPAKVIQRTNELVIKEVNAAGSMFVTMFYGIYDRSGKVFRYSNAGHNPPIFIDNSSSIVSFLEPHGTPVGIIEGQEYGQSEIQMNEGDMVILFTDGVVEAKNSRGDMFGVDMLKTIILKHKDLSSAEIVQKIKEAVFTFCEEEAQFDDLTLLIFKVQ